MKGSEEEARDRGKEQLEASLLKSRDRVLVLSNKGGVGKSFIAVSLAVGLARRGSNVGLLDADIHGPSIAKMLGFEGKFATGEPGIIRPFRISDRLAAFSMASLLETGDTPVIWRGPIKANVLRQFLTEIDWGLLDYLIMDAPPGTGDEPLSICQISRLTGAVVVTTPQDVALLDSRKCVSFLRHLSVRVLGIVENMSGLTCPHCGARIDLFKMGGGELAARELGVPFLGRVPLDPRVVETSDRGQPYLDNFPDTDTGRAIMEIVGTVAQSLKQA